MKGKISYVFVGLVIIAGLFSTRVKEIDADTMNLIKLSHSIESEKIFPGYNMSKYPMDINYDKIEFRYYKDKISKQKPLYPPAFSAVPEEDGPVLKVLGLNDFRNVFDMGSASKENISKAYVSMLLHEGFHCYQMDHGLKADDSEKIIDGNLNDEKDSKTFYEIQKRLDNDEDYKKLWIDEIKGLINFRDHNDNSSYEIARKKMDNYLHKKLTKEDYDIYSNYSKEMETIEGTARYVENCVLESFAQKKNGVFNDEFVNGTNKFYLSGSIKTEILKNKGKLESIKFDLSKTLDDFME